MRLEIGLLIVARAVMASKKGLLVVDVQNDFLPGGSLAVTGGDEILPTVYELVRDESFAVVVASKVRSSCAWHEGGPNLLLSSRRTVSTFKPC